MVTAVSRIPQHLEYSVQLFVSVTVNTFVVYSPSVRTKWLWDMVISYSHSLRWWPSRTIIYFAWVLMIWTKWWLIFWAVVWHLRTKMQNGWWLFLANCIGIINAWYQTYWFDFYQFDWFCIIAVFFSVPAFYSWMS